MLRDGGGWLLLKVQTTKVTDVRNHTGSSRQLFLKTSLSEDGEGRARYSGSWDQAIPGAIVTYRSCKMANAQIWGEGGVGPETVIGSTGNDPRVTFDRGCCM